MDEALSSASSSERARLPARLLSARGEAAIAVIRLASAEQLALLTSGTAPAPGRFGLRRLHFDGIVEDALVVRLEDGTIELHVHGNPTLVETLLASLRVDSGCVGTCARAAGSDARAIDYAHAIESADDHGDGNSTAACPYVDADASLLERAIVADLPRARTPAALGAMLAQLDEEGLVGLERDLRAAGCPAFGAAAAQRRARTSGGDAALRARVDAALATGDELEPWLEPRRVVLRGDVNAGKSSFFNLLLGRERVRSGAERALTRDPVEEVVDCAGLPIRLVDTAGQAVERDEIDAAAQAMADVLEQSADFVLRVASLDHDTGDAPRAGEARVWTHLDRSPGFDPEALARRLAADGSIALDATSTDPALRQRAARWLCATLLAFEATKRARNEASSFGADAARSSSATGEQSTAGAVPEPPRRAAWLDETQRAWLEGCRACL